LHANGKKQLEPDKKRHFNHSEQALNISDQQKQKLEHISADFGLWKEGLTLKKIYLKLRIL